MKTATDIRKDAREALTGKWWKAVAIVALFVIATSVLNVLDKYVGGGQLASILAFAITIIEVPLGFGFMISFIKLKRGEAVKAWDFFEDGLSNFKRAWGVFLHVLLKMLVPIIIFGVLFVPFCAFILGSVLQHIDVIQEAELAYGRLAIVFFVLLIADSVYFTIRSLLYYFANYIAYDNPEMTTKEAVEKSAELMKGKRGDLFLLLLSFAGWAILSICTLFIGFFWLIPYAKVATVCFYENLINKAEE